MTGSGARDLHGFEPRRAGIVLAVVVGVSAALGIAFPAAGFVGGFAIVLLGGICVLATRQAIALWRGTVEHETIAGAPAVTGMSRERFQAFTPSAIIAADGLLVAFVALVTINDTAVGSILMTGGALVAIAFMAGGLSAAIFLRPRLLLPATMRARRAA